MIDKIATVHPEIALLIGATLCLFTGLSSSWIARGTTRAVAMIALFVSLYLSVCGGNAADGTSEVAGLASYAKIAITSIGILLLMLMGGVSSRMDSPAGGLAGFDPGKVMRGEFIAFFLFSLTGAMLCAGADDLVWLFLALELTSLPTYVMAAAASDSAKAQESAVKYFFLGALAAAVFLYGFALIYGATGSTGYDTIAAQVGLWAADASAGTAGSADATVAGNTGLFVAGLVLAIVGVSFKIAAAPMHFYAADVYEGAATPVTAFLAFVPKTAGFVSLLGLLGLSTALLPEDRLPIDCTLWIMAAVTMTVGNVLGLMQQNVKRVLAYSSVAHSGYMIVGLLAIPVGFGTTNISPNEAIGNGVAAVLFYLIAYGLSTLGAFGVLISLERDGHEAQTYDDLGGLVRSHPILGVIMLVSVLSLLGLPPLVGFLGKIYLFGSAVQQGYIGLVIIAVLNSAVSAVYYLRIASACFFAEPNRQVRWSRTPGAGISAAFAAVAALVLGLSGNWLVDAARKAGIKPGTHPEPQLVQGPDAGIALTSPQARHIK